MTTDAVFIAFYSDQKSQVARCKRYVAVKDKQFFAAFSAAKKMKSITFKEYKE